MILPTQPLYLPQQTGAAWHYDAMSVDGQGGTLADFAATQSLADLTGNGHTLTQATAMDAPSYRLRTQDNKNTMTFNAAKAMTAPNIAYAGEITVMALIECDVTFVSAAGTFVSYGAGGGISIGNGSVDFSKVRFSCNGVGNFETTTPGFLINGQFLVLTCVLKNNAGTWTVDFYKNGTFIETVAAAAPISPANDFVLGCLSMPGLSGGWLGQVEMMTGWHSDIATNSPAIFNAAHTYYKVRGNL